MGTGSFLWAASSVRWGYVCIATGTMAQVHAATPPLGCERAVLRRAGARGVNRLKPVLAGRTQMKAELGDMACRLLADVSVRR